MQFNYSYAPERTFIAADLQRFVDFLEVHGVESLTNLKITCYPWRNGKRLQAVNERGEIRPITFDLELGDQRYDGPEDEARLEPLTIRERPDELGNFGLATAFDHDD